MCIRTFTKAIRVLSSIGRTRDCGSRFLTKVKFNTGSSPVEPSQINKRRNKMKDVILVEIEAGEGGNDAKLLVRDLMNVYVKAAGRSSL